MKRHSHLTPRIAELDNLLLAFRKACRGKQEKTEVKEYHLHLMDNLRALRQQILTGEVDVGHYHYFTIYDPKERVICAASFGERVLHHAIMNVCHESFDRCLIDNTFATRIGKGTYSALDHAVKTASRYTWLAKLDVRKYYDTLLKMFFRIIDSYHHTPGYGLPIGNLTSQYFANAYLCALDHLAQERWGARGYTRYMDDIVFGADDKNVIREICDKMACYASEELELTMKPPVLHRSAVGMPFLGYRVLPYRYVLSGRSKRRFRSRLLQAERQLSEGKWTQEEYASHVVPLTAFVCHGETRKFRQSCLALI